MKRVIEHAIARAIPSVSGTPFRVQVPGRNSLVIRQSPTPHPVLGAVDEITDVRGNRITVCARINWEQPERIPALWNPGCLPRGAGSAVLNVIAKAATEPLRYRGPYPSAALYNTLADCFDADGSEAMFTEGGEQAAASGREVEPVVAFTPRPFRRVEIGSVCVQSREEIEAVFAAGHRFDRRQVIGRRLLANANGLECAFEIGAYRSPAVVTLDVDGVPIAEPTPPRPLELGHVGAALPAAATRAVWSTLEQMAPVLLRPALAKVRDETELAWGDTGLSLARVDGDRLLIHAGFALSDLETAALLAALISAAQPVAFRLAQAYAEASALSGAGS